MVIDDLLDEEEPLGLDVDAIHVTITRDGKDVTEEFFPRGRGYPYKHFLPDKGLRLVPCVNQLLSALYAKQMTSKQLLEEQYDILVSLAPVLPPYFNLFGERIDPNRNKPKTLHLTFIKGHAFLVSDLFDMVQLPLTGQSLLTLATAHPVQRAVAALRVESASHMSPIRAGSSIPFSDIIPLAAQGCHVLTVNKLAEKGSDISTAEARKLLGINELGDWGSIDLGAPVGLALIQEKSFQWYADVAEGTDSILLKAILSSEVAHVSPVDASDDDNDVDWS